MYVCADVFMYLFDRSVLSQGQNGRQIFVVDRDQRRGIPTLDSFLALNFSMADGTVMSDVTIPVKDSHLHTHYQPLTTYIHILKLTVKLSLLKSINWMHSFKVQFALLDRRVHAQPDGAVEYGAGVKGPSYIHTYTYIHICNIRTHKYLSLEIKFN